MINSKPSKFIINSVYDYWDMKSAGVPPYIPSKALLWLEKIESQGLKSHSELYFIPLQEDLTPALIISGPKYFRLEISNVILEKQFPTCFTLNVLATLKYKKLLSLTKRLK